MKNLLIFGLLLIISSCTKDDTSLFNDASIADEISFNARSKKAKKGNYRGHLSGLENQGQGEVQFTFEGDNSSVYFKLIVANMEDVTRAYLYHNHMGHDHAVLTLSGPIAGTSNGILAEGVLTDADITCSCSDMSHHTLANLRKHMEDGETYVVVHSTVENGDVEGMIN